MNDPNAPGLDPASPRERPHNLRTEYDALTRYFTTVIQFRFTTAAFFIAAVGLIVGLKTEPTPAHYVLLFLFALGIWIVELRHRSLFRELLTRGRQIEREWGYPSGTKEKSWAFLSQMTPYEARDELLARNATAPCPDTTPLKTKILWFRTTSALSKFFRHTVGLDIIYFSTMGYAIWRLLMPTNSAAVTKEIMIYQTGVGFLALVVLIGIGLACLGYGLMVRSRPDVGKTLDHDPQNNPYPWYKQFWVVGFVLSVCGVLLTVASLLLFWLSLPKP